MAKPLISLQEVKDILKDGYIYSPPGYSKGGTLYSNSKELICNIPSTYLSQFYLKRDHPYSCYLRLLG